MEPILRETLNNVIRLGPAPALTGPVARGDVPVIAGHLAAIEAWDPLVAQIYRSLGRVAVTLASSNPERDPVALRSIEALLRTQPPKPPGT